jgi:hypothetical protein
VIVLMKQAGIKNEAPADDKTDDKQPASPAEDKVNHESEKFIHFFCEHHQPKLQTVSS